MEPWLLGKDSDLKVASRLLASTSAQYQIHPRFTRASNSIALSLCEELSPRPTFLFCLCCKWGFHGSDFVLINYPFEKDLFMCISACMYVCAPLCAWCQQRPKRTLGPMEAELQQLRAKWVQGIKPKFLFKRSKCHFSSPSLFVGIMFILSLLFPSPTYSQDLLNIIHDFLVFLPLSTDTVAQVFFASHQGDPGN